MKFKLVKYGITGLTAAILCFIFVFFPILNSHLPKAQAALTDNYTGTSTSYSKTNAGTDYIGIKCTGSGTFTVPSGVDNVQVFLVDGGSGGKSTGGTCPGGKGGSYSITNMAVVPGDVLNVVVGTGGSSNNSGTASKVVYGGTTILSNTSGGDGGPAGYSGSGAEINGKAGVTEFGDSAGTRYSGGGGGGTTSTYTIPQGADGGGNGALYYDAIGWYAAAGAGTNGGGGGGGAYTLTAASGGNGVVIIRWPNASPSILVSSPSANQSFSEVAGFNQIAVSGTVNDADSGDTLQIYYRVDGNSGAAGTQLGSDITADTTDQAWAGTIDVASVAAGSHTLYLWATDDKSGKSDEKSITFNMDKTAPTITAPTLVVDSATQITVQANANDSTGLSSTPYLYNRNDSNIGTWQAGDYIDSGLAPNTQYQYKYKAVDAVGNVSDYSDTVVKYTLALNPTGLTCASRTDTSLTFSITNAAGQGETPSNRIEVKLRDAGQGGAVVSASDYSTDYEGRAVTGLSTDTEYEVWCITQNGDGIANAPVKLIDSIKTNMPPVLNMSTPIANQTFSEVDGYRTISITGSVTDVDDDDVTVSAVIDGITKTTTIEECAGGKAFSLSFDVAGDSLAENAYNIDITANDGNGTDTKTVSVIVDTTAPSVPTIVLNNNAWTNQAVEAFVSNISDTGGSGVWRAEYSIGNGYTPHAGADNFSINVTDEGQYEVSARVLDNVGHISPAASAVAKIDKTGPVISFSGVSQGSSYYSVSPICDISDSISGLQSSNATLSKNGSAVPWNSGNNISDPGSYTITANATDMAGNISQADISFIVEVYIPPVNYPATVTVTSPADGSIYSAKEGHTAIQAAGTANDPEGDTSTVTGTLAGATKTIYVTQGIGDRSFSLLWDVVSDSIPEGSHDVNITAGGNTVTANVIVDKTAPEITFSGITEGATAYSASPHYDATDYLSGVSETSAILNKDGLHTEWSNDRLIDQAGSYSLTAYATDAVGNTCTKVLKFTIIEPDVTPPIITVTGVVDGQTYYSSITPEIDVQDSSISTVTATYNGNSIGWQSGNLLSAPGEYVISVSASDSSGNQASSSVAFSIESISIIPQANTTDTSATIQWSSVPGATGYQVYRNGELVYTGTSNSFQDTGLTPGTTYQYKVSVITPSGIVEGETITVNTASQESVSIGEVSAQSVPLTWEPVEGATEYRLYRDGVLVYTGTDTQWTDTTATAGDHVYQIVAITPVGNVELPTVSVTVPAAVVPEIHSGTIDSDSASLTWDTVEGATEYRLYRDDVLIYMGTDAQYTDPNVQPGQSYIYRIEAITSSGTIELSPITVSVPLALTSINIDKVTYGYGESVIITVVDPNTIATEITAQVFGAPGNPTVTLYKASSDTDMFVGSYLFPADMEEGSFTVQYATSQGSPIAISGIYSTDQTLPVNLGNSQLTVGSTIKITPLISGSATYTTSDPSVCTVDSDGTIHVVGSGEAIITIQVGDRIAEIRIIGLPQTDSSTANLVVEPTTATLSLKKTTSFKATLNGTDITDNAVWVADDSDIAEATAGQVTGLATGQTTVTIAHNNTQRKVLVTVVSQTGTGTSSGGSGGSSGSGSTSNVSTTTTTSNTDQISQSTDTQASGWANTANNYFEAKGLDLDSLSEPDVAQFIQDSIGGTMPATSGIDITGTRLTEIVQDILSSSALAGKVNQTEVNAWASSRSQLQAGVTKDEVYVTVYWILQMAGEI